MCVWSPPCAIDLKFRIALRKLLPSCDTRPQPNINRTMTKTTRSSATPNPNIVSPTGARSGRPNVGVSESSAPIRVIIYHSYQGYQGLVASVDGVKDKYKNSIKTLVGARPPSINLSLSKPTPECQPARSAIEKGVSQSIEATATLDCKALPQHGGGSAIDSLAAADLVGCGPVGSD
jgi:hypothetical protein